jgi:hypothetical protein
MITAEEIKAKYWALEVLKASKRPKVNYMTF